MRLIYDTVNRRHMIMIENFRPSLDEATKAHEWVKNAMTTPETIGGIFWQDLEENRHLLEMREQGLYTLLLVYQQLASGQPISIVYDYDVAPDYFICNAFNLPKWLLKILRIFGMYKPTLTYKNYLKVIDDLHTRKQVSKPVPKQSDSVCPPAN